MGSLISLSEAIYSSQRVYQAAYQGLSRYEFKKVIKKKQADKISIVKYIRAVKIVDDIITNEENLWQLERWKKELDALRIQFSAFKSKCKMLGVWSIMLQEL